jgi:hypothetical protein
LTPHVGQQWIFETELFTPCLVGVVEIYTDAQDLGICGLELGKIKLEGQRFLRSRIGERADIEKQHHRLLSCEIGALDFLAGGRRQREVRSLVPDLQRYRRAAGQKSGTPEQNARQ